MITLSQLWPWHMAVVPFFTMAGQFILVVGVSFAVLLLLTSYLRFQLILDRAKEKQQEELDSLDAFHLWIIERLGTAHRMPEPFGVMLIDLRTDPSEADANLNPRVVDIARELVRRHVRESDQVGVIDDGRIGVVAGATRVQNEAIVQRILKGLRERTHKISEEGFIRLYPRAGVATFPENGEKVAELIASASDALKASTEQGQQSFCLSEHQAETHDQQVEEAEEAGDSPLVDPLTGVLKRRYLPKAMPKFVARHRKNGQPVSLIFMDLDRLAKYNEHYGSEAGDVLLKGVGEVLQRCLREDDLIARYGEDDFVVLLGCTSGGAQSAAQRVMAEIRRSAFMLGSRPLKAAVSAGVSGCPEHGKTPRQLLEAAGLALRTAKEKGGSLCMVYDPSMRQAERQPERVDRF